jgi:hypothetical protein
MYRDEKSDRDILTWVINVMRKEASWYTHTYVREIALKRKRREIERER